MGYQRLKLPKDTPPPPEVCAVHRLMNYPKVTALLDAEQLRKNAAPGTQDSMTQAQKCQNSPGDVWHIYKPSKASMKGIRRKLRKAGILPPLQDS